MAGMQTTRRILADNPETKWGFVVYRTTYQDDDQWTRFMDHINTRVRLQLEAEGDAELFPRIDWSVQEDATLDGARVGDIRRRFGDWITNGGERETAAPRFSACIMVCQFHVERVLGGPSAEEHDTFASGWVDLVSRYREEGYVSVGSAYLIPRAWSLLQSVGWSAINVGDEEVFCN